MHQPIDTIFFAPVQKSTEKNIPISFQIYENGNIPEFMPFYLYWAQISLKSFQVYIEVFY